MGFWDYRQRGGEESPGIPVRVESAAEDLDVPDPDLAIQKEWLIQARMNQERFDYFFNHFYPRILRFCYSSVLDRDEAEDLTAETFESAFRDLWKFRWQGVSFGAWLYRIASNRLKKRYRYEQRHPREPLPENLLGEVLFVSKEPDPERRLELTRECDRLARYMSRLSPEDRICLDLRYREGLSSQEIAAIVGEKWGTIASRISRAKRKLQEMADEDDAGSQ